MSDIITFNESFAGFDSTAVFDQSQDTRETNPNANDRANEATPRGRGRGLLQAALARRQRTRAAVMVDLSQRAEETREQAAPDRAALRRQLRQAVQDFQNTDQPGRAGGEGGERRGVVAIPVGLNRGPAQGGEGGPGMLQRPGFQTGEQPAILAARETSRQDGNQMAASFQRTALGTALNRNQTPGAQPTGPANRGTLQRPGNAPGQLNFGAARANQGAQDLGSTNRQAQGPLARVQERFNRPAGNFDVGQGNPMVPNVGMLGDQGPGGALSAGVQSPGNGGTPLRFNIGGGVPGANPGGPMDRNVLADARELNQRSNTPGNVFGEANINPDIGRYAEVLGGPTPAGQNMAGPIGANPDADPANAAELPGGDNIDIARVGAAAEPPAPEPANRDEDAQTDLQRPPSAGTPPQQVGGDGGPVGPTQGDLMARTAPEQPAANAAPPAPEPANRDEEAQTDLLRPQSAGTPPQQVGGDGGPVGPTQGDLMAPTAPEQPAANAVPPAPDPLETPAEAGNEDGAGRTPPGVVADAQVRGGLVEQPEDTAPAAGAPGAPAEANRAAAGPGAPEEARPARAETPPEEEAGAEAVPAGAAEGEPARRAAGGPENETAPTALAEEEPAEIRTREEQETARAVATYELQQQAGRANEPNEGRTAMELFIR